MNVTRDVITDLLPAYFANEASADSRALVEEFFRQDPEFARLADERKDKELLGSVPCAALPKNHELEALIRTRVFLRMRSVYLALAIMFTLFPLSSVFSSEGLVWMMLRDAPVFANTCWAIAIGCWFLFFRTRRKLRSTGI